MAGFCCGFASEGVAAASCVDGATDEDSFGPGAVDMGFAAGEELPLVVVAVPLGATADGSVVCGDDGAGETVDELG